jgi:S-adenosylmethionine synthetase
MQIFVEQMFGKPVSELQIEIVERKGIGHPDTICDSIMDVISVALSREYLKEFGSVLHHNIDKGLLAAGRTEFGFGGGEVIRPMELTIGDRATRTFGSKTLPVADIAVASAKKWFQTHLRHVDPMRHVDYRVVLETGSAELTDIFTRPGKFRPANDTSAAVGYYPLSPAEEMVLKLERFLNSKGFKEKFPETGEDVKIMGRRCGRTLDLTVAMPLLASCVHSEGDYFDHKTAIHEVMREFVLRHAPFPEISVHFNALDKPGRDLNGIYLSLLGTSAENADSGQVGRGNRVNGLIPVNRPIGTEAAAGKNPMSHVGKIYNILAHKAARQIYENVPGLIEVYVFLTSRIGSPIDQPQLAAVQVLPKPACDFRQIFKKSGEVLEAELANVSQLCNDLSQGKYGIC